MYVDMCSGHSFAFHCLLLAVSDVCAGVCEKEGEYIRLLGSARRNHHPVCG